MFFLLGCDKKKQKEKNYPVENQERVRELFFNGKFPVSTTNELDENRKISRVLGLVVCRAYNSEEAFFGMAAQAVNKGAQAIIGYHEQVAFHPDGSKFFSCYGTAIQFSTNALRLEEGLSI